MTSRPVAAAVAMALVVVAAAAALSPAVAAEPTFSGSLLVQWQDAGGVHQATLRVAATRQGVRVAGPGGGGRVPWPVVALPAATTKYQVASGPAGIIAGRPVTGVDLNTADGRPRERLYVDDASGLVLGREVFDDDGAVVRTVQFEDVRITGEVPERAGALPRRVRASAFSPTFPAPPALAGGYVRLAAVSRAEGVQVVYSDGLHALSVFERPGRFGGATAPDAAVAVGPTTARRYTWAGGEAVVWQNGPAVTVVVGDGPPGDVLTAARSLPRSRPPDLAQRVRHRARQWLDRLGAGV